MQKSIYIIGIGGIGVSAIARYYNNIGCIVYGDDAVHSELTASLEKEGILLCSLEETLQKCEIEKLIYTEGVPKDHSELKLAQEKNIKVLTYPQALAEIANNKKLISIAGTHGKSTTTSLTSLVLKNSDEGFTAVVGTILKEFENKNFFHRGGASEENHFFVIEACEYKRSFLNYKPTVGIITNIEIDHLDYFKDEADYLSAFKSYVGNIKSGGFAIMNGDDLNCQKLLGLRDDINYIEIFDGYFCYNDIVFNYPNFSLQVPGNHILFDAKIAYIVGHMLGIDNDKIVASLESYAGVWRRMEIIRTSENNNILMSDYGHHPTEIRLTLDAIKEKYPDRHLYTIFQPHQYSRTIELLDQFARCFSSADTLVIPNIYESRDTAEDKANMSVEKLIQAIEHPEIINGKDLENTLIGIQEFEKNNSDSIILLLGAGNVDTLRYKL